MQYIMRWLPVLVLAGIATGPKECQRGRNHALQRGADTLLVIEKTPCYGTCPIYSLHFIADGTVKLDARRFVPREGQFVLRMDSAELREWIILARQAVFEATHEEAPRAVPDLPGMRIRLDDSTYFFQVIEPFPLLHELARRSDDLLLSPEWQPDSSDHRP